MMPINPSYPDPGRDLLVPFSVPWKLGPLRPCTLMRQGMSGQIGFVINFVAFLNRVGVEDARVTSGSSHVDQGTVSG